MCQFLGADGKNQYHCFLPVVMGPILCLETHLSYVYLFLILCSYCVQEPARLLRPRDFPDKSTGVGYHFLKEIFPTQGSNPGPPHYRQTLYPLSHQGQYSIVNSRHSVVEPISRMYSSYLTKTLCLLISNFSFSPSPSLCNHHSHSDSMHLIILDT